MRIRGLFVLTALGLAATGCSSIEPWVKPYDRENLADPIMSFSRAPISQDFLDHVFESREGSRGATGGGGGGCGCNCDCAAPCLTRYARVSRDTS